MNKTIIYTIYFIELKYKSKIYNFYRKNAYTTINRHVGRLIVCNNGGDHGVCLLFTTLILYIIYLYKQVSQLFECYITT